MKRPQMLEGATKWRREVCERVANLVTHKQGTKVHKRSVGHKIRPPARSFARPPARPSARPRVRLLTLPCPPARPRT